MRAPNAEKQKAYCATHNEKTYREDKGKRALYLLYSVVTRLLSRAEIIPHTNSLGQLDTHPSSLSKKTGICSLTATVLRTTRFFWLASPPYVSATFAGCLLALLTISRATLASKGAGIAGKANRGTMYINKYTTYIYLHTLKFFSKVLTPGGGYAML